MKYQNNIAFWSDISIVALESIMSQKGDTNSIQYANVRNATEDIIRHFINSDLTKDVLQSSILKFLEIRQNFANSGELAATAPPEFVPATLVAMCIQSTTEDDMDDEAFSNLIADAYAYLARYTFK